MWDAARSSEGGETDDGDDDDGPAPGANQLAWLKVGESRGGRRERAREGGLCVLLDGVVVVGGRARGVLWRCI